MGNIPLQQDCDMNDPDEHALWALVGLAGPTAHAPLVLPPQVLRKWSRRMWECGFRHNPELQEIKYVPPPLDTNWVLGAAGQWVGIDTPLPAEITAPDTSHLTDEEKRVLLARLVNELNPNDLVDGDRAEVHE
ncbi:putative DUF2744 family protein [Corynebacterium mustelae]|uniref:Putative DUF2744 family protein n=1 Tax=Corynebacterium mustelae TaxID=571915 RepID=A0A0G3H0H5_9CORY|nr:DUF2744 domain-containing protein [Corynebacterium mustelae]AKK04602.1 putative DUF2744 family protein [Corynebacterium mustelae]